MMILKAAFLIVLIQIIHLSVCIKEDINFREKEKEALEEIFNRSQYNAHIRPPGDKNDEGPVTIYVNMYVGSISNIDDKNMEFSVQLLFRQRWTDERLKYHNFGRGLKSLNLDQPSSIWMPDLFFPNENRGYSHDILKPNVFIKISPSGEVFTSRRVSLTLSCFMDLKLYPMDRQVCHIDIGSYGFQTDDLVLSWKEEKPVLISKKLQLSTFTLEKYQTDNINFNTSTGQYSTLRLQLFFKRQINHYLIQIYIPCSMLVIVSWFSFWLDPALPLTRVILGLSTLLTTTILTSNINAALPPVSYTKAVDVWTGVCITFIFAALLELIVVNYLSRFDYKMLKTKEMENCEANHTNSDSGDNNSAFVEKPLVGYGNPGNVPNSGKSQQYDISKLNCMTWLSKFPTRSKKIDVISRILFPFSFIIFVIIYWVTYLSYRDVEYS